MEHLPPSHSRVVSTWLMTFLSGLCFTAAPIQADSAKLFPVAMSSHDFPL